MNIGQQIDFMQAVANPFPVHASFESMEGGGYKCKMCGAKMKDQGQAVDHILNKHREMEAREFSQSRRKKLAKSGAAMPGGGFPIVNKEDLSNARQAIGRAKNPSAARAHIRERAKALGVKLPSKWSVKGQEEFSPANRLRMPAPAGTKDAELNPAMNESIKTAGFKKIKLKIPKGGRGASYWHKAAKMGHRLTLSARSFDGLPNHRQKKKPALSAERTGYKGGCNCGCGGECGKH